MIIDSVGQFHEDHLSVEEVVCDVYTNYADRTKNAIVDKSNEPFTSRKASSMHENSLSEFCIRQSICWLFVLCECVSRRLSSTRQFNRISVYSILMCTMYYVDRARYEMETIRQTDGIHSENNQPESNSEMHKMGVHFVVCMCASTHMFEAIALVTKQTSPCAQTLLRGTSRENINGGKERKLLNRKIKQKVAIQPRITCAPAHPHLTTNV